MDYKTVIITVFISGCLTFPVDDPIRIDLPVYDQPQSPQASSDDPLAYDTAFAKSIVPENHPGAELDQSAGGNLISYKLQAASNILGNTLDSKSAAHETEGFGSKALSIKENVQNIVAGLFQVPGKIFSKITRLATEKLNNLGGRLIGL
ncbi:hypothetical protein OBRU01_03762 [Operophtera brumata]|uniref:Uncharacterized protein n=1 Tax=Operophtera brumata TaxID=104452 RepID=A0A0L7LQA7_OPEBR|nr:hypothetical protein OBRU01_03762 [Operophtera brumata]